MTVKILIGDCRQVLKTLPDESVHCVVTSPPYFGLRDYGVAGQIGLEPTPEAYVAELVKVFQEVRRVLRSDGTLWLNLGDSYSSGGRKTRDPGKSKIHPSFEGGAYRDGLRPADPPGIKPKDLLGIPWRVAFALQADGWWLRQDIIWSKPNPMPESVTDRCTKAHEYIFLLTKRERYYCDMEAISESANSAGEYKSPDGWDTSSGAGGHGSFHRQGREKGKKGYEHKTPGRSGNSERKPRPGPTDSGKHQAGSVPWESVRRNKRSVWTVSTQPYPEAHFATFPPALIEPCILAGSRVGDIVFDPFFGSGTTGMVAERLGRQWIGIDIQPDYAPLQKKRIQQRGFPL